MDNTQLQIEEYKNEQFLYWQTPSVEAIIDFLKTCFPNHFNKPFASFHLDILSFLLSNNRCAIGAPRKHGKTELISFGWVMWNLVCNPNNRLTIIISNNYANAVKYLVPIKEELENNNFLKVFISDQKSDKWSENEIELKCKKKVIVGGSDFKIRGQKYLQYRPDMIIIDDAEDDEMVRSDERRENFEHWLLYSLDPAMTMDDNKIIMIGTILHRDSQLSKLMEGGGKYLDWESRCYKAINDDLALWQDGVSLEFLLNEKNKDPHKFAQEYMNNPVAYEHALFKQEYFDDYKDESLPKDLLINITVDLACTDKTYSDYTVIMPCGIDTLGDLWVLPYKRVKYADPDKIIDEIFSMYDKYSNCETWKFGKVGIEKVAFQRFLIKNFDRERKIRGKRFPVVEIEAKGDKITRISQLQPMFSAGDIHIKDSMIDLKEELLDFPRAKHDDVADSLCMHLNFITHRPLKTILTNERWSVTPEKQRNKALDKILTYKKPSIYSRFNGKA